uniref:Uncharacterized protein n=1 Tax=Colobus angolensis palliatus TaxID=336983 RepID=A0A2K5HPN1_COLAP
MEGSPECVSNLIVCNLAYCGKLEEFKESILADKSLTTTRHTGIVEFLLHLGVPVNDKDDDEIVKTLLGKGAQVNAVNQNGCTPLHYAAFKNRREIAVMLLEGRANPHAKDHYEATALHWAAAKGFDTSKVTIVKEITALIRESESPLFGHE